jgi:hypothetical protein
MPYIKKTDRKKFDAIVSKIRQLSVKYGQDNVWGTILERFCKNFIEPSYNNYKNFLGEITESAHEIIRRYKLTANPYDTLGDFYQKPDGDLSEEEKGMMDDIFKLMSKEVKVNGDLNYCIFAYAVRHSSNLDRFVQGLLATARSLRLEILAPYEDLKIKENGDVE